MIGDEIIHKVKEQYEHYPYPRFEEEQFARPAEMPYIKVLFWPNDKKRRLKVLDVGCGTGTLEYTIARLFPAEVELYAIDLSESALSVCRERIEKYDRSNIHLFQKNVYDIGDLGEKFDYIIASGVLHHLPNPAEGLACLREVLKDDGILSIMVYGTYGRQSIYMIQSLLRFLVREDADFDDKIQLTKLVVQHLPEKHLFNFIRNRYLYDQEKDEYIHSSVGQDFEYDAGLVDLLLHVQDRSFTVPEIYDWLESQNIKLLRFENSLYYEPKMYIDDPDLVQRFDALPAKQHHACAELLNGYIHKHNLFACKTVHSVPYPTLDDNWKAIYPVILKTVAAERGIRAYEKDQYGLLFQSDFNYIYTLNGLQKGIIFDEDTANFLKHCTYFAAYGEMKAGNSLEEIRCVCGFSKEKTARIVQNCITDQIIVLNSELSQGEAPTTEVAGI